MRERELLLVALWLAACHDEERRFREIAPAGERGTRPLSGLVPGPTAQSSSRKLGELRKPALSNPYEANAWAIAEGKRLFNWYNCVGCHANGGGGMGPALIDDVWRYGNSPESVYTSIAHGRPNGMPAFGQRVPEQQVWQLVAYVRALGKLAPLGAMPSRNDMIGGVEPESQQPAPSAKPNPEQR